MKFTVEVDDFWLDEEELSEALESHLSRDVTSQIHKSIKDNINDLVTKKIKELTAVKLEAMIDAHLSSFMEAGKLTRNNKEIPITQYLKNIFDRDNAWGSVDRKVKDYAASFARDMKLQYDAAFANKIVCNMKEQGLLKNEVVQILLDGK